MSKALFMFNDFKRQLSTKGVDINGSTSVNIADSQPQRTAELLNFIISENQSPTDIHSSVNNPFHGKHNKHSKGPTYSRYPRGL